MCVIARSICHLTLLERLDLGVNEIDTLVSLTPVIFVLTLSIQQINNPFQSGVIGSLESLSELWLDGNLLNSLPDVRREGEGGSCCAILLARAKFQWETLDR